MVYQEKLSKRLLAAVPPIRWLYDRYTYWKSSQRHFGQFVGKGHAEIFGEIYRNNQWGSASSASGLGSETDATLAVRTSLPELLTKRGVRSMLDIPCGDFHWMKQVDLRQVEYTGADVVPELIGKLERDHRGPGRSFRVLDLTRDPLPRVDLVFCRDCLIHFSDEDVLKALKNIAASGSRYLLTTTYTGRVYNKKMVTGDFRQINLELPPFRLPKPLLSFSEGWRVDDNRYADRSLALWRLEDLHGL